MEVLSKEKQELQKKNDELTGKTKPVEDKNSTDKKKL